MSSPASSRASNLPQNKFGGKTVVERTEGNRSSRASPAQSASLAQKKNNNENQPTNQKYTKPKKPTTPSCTNGSAERRKTNQPQPKSRCCPLCVNTGNCRHIAHGVSTVAPLRSSTVHATSVLAVLRAVCQIKPSTFYFCLKREFLP